MKFFITGGAGCIGSELVERLLKQGHEVVVYDNFSTGKEEHMETVIKHKNLHMIEGDILDIEKLADSMCNSDVVVHLAAHSTTKFQEGDSTDTALKINIVGTHNVLEAMRTNKIKKIIFASSQAVYGATAEKNLSENSLLHPMSFYAASKASGEQLIEAFCSVFGMQCWIFRFANVVGGKSRKSGTAVITDFIKKLRENPKELEILGDGKQTKSYITIEDSINAMLFCFENAKDVVNIFNVASNDVITVDEIARIIIEEMKLSSVKILHTGGKGGWIGDMPVAILDTKKIMDLGWKPLCGSREAVKEAVRSYAGRQ